MPLSWEQERACLDREVIKRRGLFELAKRAWHIVEPAVVMRSNWHLGVISEHLEAVTAGEIKRLIINVPPGCMKSLMVCVFWPSWVWTRQPEHKWIFASFDGALSARDARKMRDIVNSAWWKARWPDVHIPYTHSRKVREYVNNHAGLRFSTSVCGTVTGWHANTQVVDDAHKPLDLEGGKLDSRKKLGETWNWYTKTMPTRLADPVTAARVLIMQRIHDLDIVGQLKRAMDKGTGEQYEMLVLPMEYEPRKWAFTCLAPRAQDPRTEPGELLWPERFGTKQVKDLKLALGDENSASAQLQQDPIAAGGNIFKAQWWQHWGVVGSRFPELPQPLRLEQHWDCSFKGTEDSSWVVGQLWGFTVANAFLIDQVRGKWGFSDTIEQIEAFSKKHPRAWTKRIEDKANGPAILDVLKNKIPGLEPAEPSGDKVARASSVQCVFRTMNVWLPPYELAPWLSGYKEEMERFPKAPNDDQVDATSQALREFAAGTRTAAYERAMQAMA